MTYLRKYLSPFGEILLAADEKGLSGLWFVGAKYFGKGLPKDCKEGTTEALEETVHWLDEYFEGKEPKFTPPLHPDGTAFQEAVWRLLLRIPYGETVTYGELAKQLAVEMGLAHMSAQAVGGAVGRNPISLIVPCRVCRGDREEGSASEIGTRLLKGEQKARRSKTDGPFAGKEQLCVAKVSIARGY